MFNSPLSISHYSHTSSSSPFNDPSHLFSQNPPQTSAFNNNSPSLDLDEFPLPTKLTKNSSSNYNGLSTRESSIGIVQPRSRKGSFENDLLSSPSFSKEFETISDDEEINPRRLPALRACDFEIILDVIPRNLIMSPDISLVYPCYASLRLKQDLFTERPGMDILLILNIKNHEISSIIDVFQNVLPHLNDQDRLSLFTTQGDFAKRFPFRVMDEPTKSEFINECRVLKEIHEKNHPLKQVLQQSLETIKSRKYENHLSAIFLITDTDEEIALEEIINDANTTSQPIIFAFGLGQHHNSINLAQVCEHFEGKYCYTETFHALEKAMKGSISQLSDIQAKNIKLTIETNPFQLTKIYDKNIINEDSTQFYQTHRNYISLRKGIDLALEIQLPKSGSTVSDLKSSINLHFTCENLSHVNERQISLEHSKEFNIKVRPASECEISKEDVDIKSLEKFCEVKMLVRYLQVLMMVNYDLIGSGIQVLNGLKTDFSAFGRFRSGYLKHMMKVIEWTIGELDSSRLKTRDLLLLIQNLIYQAML